MRPPLLNPLFAEINSLPGIGPKLAPLLNRLLTGSKAPARLIDLLFHLPYATIDRQLCASISETTPGQQTTVKARIVLHKPPPPGRSKAAYRVIVEDNTGDLILTFFNAPAARLEKLLPVGEERYISGVVDIWDGHRQITHPDRILAAYAYDQQPAYEPVYGLTAGLFPRVLVNSVGKALERLPALPEWQEPTYLNKHHWPPFSDALKSLHLPISPESVSPLAPARLRLAYDEVLAGQLALLLIREQVKRHRGQARHGTGELVKKCLSLLPYTLTNAQSAALADIKSDLESPEKMLRLLQGDVGSGKTIVGFLAMLSLVEGGEQAALMVPTEILARQHYARLQPLCDQLGVSIALLTGRDKGASREAILTGLADGSTHLVVGTHALFQEGVSFHKLGLAVVDEQHRFGVNQRLALANKGEATDMLVMTATPIPRTLVLTYFGDMDVSNLREKPPGRKPIDTRIMSLDKLDTVTQSLARAMSEGNRVYWVCPLVTESEDLDIAAAEERFASLKSVYGDQVGLVHGKLPPREKDAAMAAFAEGITKILVSTTVIEVGVDVPEATIIIIEQAERFGLAQLHQLRGRVGRGGTQSHCLLLYKHLGNIARQRLETMRQTEDGFEIAEKDLKLRGEGDILGTRQSGIPGFRLAVAEKHDELLNAARDDAKLALSRDPGLKTPRGEALRLLLYLFEKDAAAKLLSAG
jgi:ATP-dependent DNA helicase RecG